MMGQDWHVARCDTNACVKAKLNPDGSVTLGSTEYEQTMHFTAQEWRAFIADSVAGKFPATVS